MTRGERQRPGPAGEQRREGVDWLGKPALRLHAAMIVGVAGSATAAWLEWTRALSGKALAWAYSFEWPLFAVMGIYLWWRLLHEVAGQRSGNRVAARPSRRGRSAAAQRVPDDDPQLAAWDAYLARLHAADPPGGPPRREPA